MDSVILESVNLNDLAYEEIKRESSAESLHLVSD